MAKKSGVQEGSRTSRATDCLAEIQRALGRNDRLRRADINLSRLGEERILWVITRQTPLNRQDAKDGIDGAIDMASLMESLRSGHSQYKTDERPQY